jgi:class 3 adenylate cyclase
MDLDLGSLSLTEIIRLQNRLSEELRRRFTRSLALSFTDIVGSTAYFARFGDEAGRRLQQRHFDLVERAFGPRGGRVVDTAGDGAFSCFPTAEAGALALVDLMGAIRADNAARAPEDALSVRASLHWGEVLTDGELVSGEAVNLASRVGQTGEGGEIRVTREAFRELPNALKLRARHVPPLALRGVPGVVETMVLEWQDRARLPIAVRVEETGEEIPLPFHDTITFGRLRAGEGGAAGNDVVLTAPNPADTQGISRFHFELRRKADGFVLRAVSGGLTEVDGAVVPRGGEAKINAGSVVRVARLLTLTFVAPSMDDAALNTLL